MPQNRESDTSRMRPGKDLIRVIHILQANKSFGITAKDMAREMEVSIRTVKRWLAAIKDIEPDLSFRNVQEIKGKLWYLPMARTRISPATADQLGSLSAIAAILKTMGYMEYGGLLNELRDNLQANSSQKHMNKIDPDLEVMSESIQVARRPGPKGVYTPSVRTTLLDAILMQRQVSFSYKNLTATKTSLKRTSPLGIIFGPRAYLVANDEDVDEVRTYALTGINNLNIIGTAITNSSFDIDAFVDRSFGTFHDGIFKEWALTFDPQAAPLLEHYEFHPNQKTRILDGGKLEIRFSCESVKEIAYECFRWSEYLVSIKPDELSQVLRKIISEMEAVLSK